MLLSLVLALQLWPTVLATHAEPAPSDDRGVWLTVDAKIDAAAKPVVEKQVRIAVADAVRELGLEPSSRGPRELVVTLAWADDSQQAYAIEYRFASMAEPTPRVVLTTTCDRCGSDELLARVRANVIELKATLLVAVEPSASTAPAVTRDPGPDALAAPRAPAPVGAIGWTGVGLLAAGGGAVIPGIALLARGDERQVVGTNNVGTDYRTPGLIVTAIGAALLTTGAVLLAVDRVRARRHRTVAGPLWGRGLVGITMEVRW